MYQFKTAFTPKLNGNVLYVEGDKATLALHRFLKASAYLNKTSKCDREALFWHDTVFVNINPCTGKVLKFYVFLLSTLKFPHNFFHLLLVQHFQQSFSV